MKTKSFIYAAALLTVIGMGSCKKSSTDTTVQNMTFVATINGASETPANASAATGTATFTYNPTTYILSGTVSYNGITPSAAHIHKGALGVAGAVIFPLGSAMLTSPISFTSSVALTDVQQADLMANLYYVNFHSPAFPNGEIRGQLMKK